MKAKKVCFILVLFTVLLGCEQSIDPAGKNEDSGNNTYGYYADKELTEAVTITLWDIDQLSDFRGNLVNSFMDEYPLITVNYIEKNGPEELREDFQTAPSSVDVLLTVSDHYGPFVSADLIQSIDDFVDLSLYVESIKMNNKTWAVPFSSGNHLMLIYNKSLVETPPVNTDELLSIGSSLTTGGNYGLVYNEGEAFWLIPWLGGFGGRVFEDDGITPTLDTEAMVNALTFEKGLEDITPNLYEQKEFEDESFYNVADRMFKSGQAAMLINGDWSLGAYQDALGDNMGVTKIPMISSTGLWPQPYISGHGFCVRTGLSEEKKIAVAKFIAYCTSDENQQSLVNQESTFPGRLSAFSAPLIQNSEVLRESAQQVEVGTPMPTVLEMRGVWDAIGPNYKKVLSGELTPSEAATQMQIDALYNIENQ